MTLRAIDVEAELTAVGRAIEALANRAFGRRQIMETNPSANLFRHSSVSRAEHLLQRLTAAAHRLTRSSDDDDRWISYDEDHEALPRHGAWTAESLYVLGRMANILRAIARRAGPLPSQSRFLGLLTPALEARTRRDRREAAMVLADMLEEKGLLDEADHLRADRYSDSAIQWVGWALGYRRSAAR